MLNEAAVNNDADSTSYSASKIYELCWFTAKLDNCSFDYLVLLSSRPAVFFDATENYNARLLVPLLFRLPSSTATAASKSCSAFCPTRDASSLLSSSDDECS